ncbi:MAG: TIR domain-containing protein [Xenococcaceae cyanobacterium]
MPSIFICYSHKDKAWLERLLEYLQTLSLEGEAEVWSDKDLEVGELWDTKIQEVLQQVKAAVLLVSQPFLNSKYIRNSELPILLKRREEEGVKIIPIFIKHSDVKNVPFKYLDSQQQTKSFLISDFQSPRNNSPDSPLYKLEEPEQDNVLLSVAQSLRSHLQSALQSSQKQSLATEGEDVNISSPKSSNLANSQPGSIKPESDLEKKRRQFLESRKQAIEEKIESLTTQINYTSNLAEVNNLEREIEEYFRQLKDINEQLCQLQQNS